MDIGGERLRQRNDKRIAIGTWRRRGQVLPTAARSDFEPKDITLEVPEELDDLLAHRQGENTDKSLELGNTSQQQKLTRGFGPTLAYVGLHGAEKLGRAALRGRSWSVMPAAKAAAAVLEDLARSCATEDRWGTTAEEELVADCAEWEGPLRALTDVIERLRIQKRYKSAQAARPICTEAYDIVTQVTTIADQRYRAVPRPYSRPPSHNLVTGSKRANAVAEAFGRYEPVIGHWYAFLFTSAAPPTTDQQLAEIATDLPVGDEVEALLAFRDHSSRLGEQRSLSLQPTLRVFEELADAVSHFETALYDSEMTRSTRG